MEVVELNVLNAAKCEDFLIKEVIGSGCSGLVVAARCTRKGIPDPNKIYAVKLLYNFCHEESSVVRNAFENEWLVLSRTLPHPNVIRFWAQFVDVIGDNFIEHLPDHIKQQAVQRDPQRNGQLIHRKAQFVVLNFHEKSMRDKMKEQTFPLPYDLARKYALDLLKGSCFLFEQQIVHFDLKIDNILVSADDHIVISDFGFAEQLSHETFSLHLKRGVCPGGNRAHIAPEVLNAYHMGRMDTSAVDIAIDCRKQSAWAVGCLIYEIVEGTHPLPDYPLGYGEPNCIVYSIDQLPHLPSHYPPTFRSSISKLLHPDPAQRLSLSEALSLIQGDGYGLRVHEPAIENLQQRLQMVTRERDLLVSQLEVERNNAIEELRAMAEQCKFVASEFDAMAEQCEKALADKEVLAREKDEAVKASLAAIEVNGELREQLLSISAERDQLRTQVDELKKRNAPEVLKVCARCQRCYVDSENEGNPCQHHPGRHIFNRWSCCYKQDMMTPGCYHGPHIPAGTEKENKPLPRVSSQKKLKQAETQ